MTAPVTIDPRYYDAVVFDLDSVVIDTARIEAAAWTQLFDDYLACRRAREGEDYSPFTGDDYRRFVGGKPRCDAITDFLRSRGISLPVSTAPRGDIRATTPPASCLTRHRVCVCDGAPG